MFFKRRRPEHIDNGLDPRGEALWDELRRRVEEEEGFLWCFISTASPPASDLFLRRFQKLAKSRKQKVSLKETALPSRLPKLAKSLVRGRWVRRYDYIWIQVSESVRDQHEGEWLEAWRETLRFLSARRQELQGRFRGIIVSGPAEMQQWLPEAMPSVWRLHPMTIDLRPSWLQRAVPDDQREEVPDQDPASDEESQGAVAEAPSEDAAVKPGRRLREALEAYRRGDLGRTVELARQIDESRAGAGRRAEAYALRARAERQAGRYSDAARHIDLALRTLESEERGDLLRWYDLAGRIAVRRQRLDQALDYYQQALEIARRRARDQAGPPAQRCLSVILNRLSEVQMRRGESESARRLGHESLKIRQQLVEDAEQPSPASLRDLSYCFYLLAMLEESEGRLEESLDHVRESLILDRRLNEQHPGPDSRRNLAATLKLAAHLKHRLGHNGEARRLRRQAEALQPGN
ncbi:MAG TPA: tetratricopeptide repeat protein [Acidobacteriota bacterium]|nr:tetratricopeptide repeat protein [Acidobacteriota bacterium]